MFNYEGTGSVGANWGCYFLFCSEEEVISIHSCPEVVEIPPPSQEVVEVSPPSHRKGPKVKLGHWHPDRE